MRRSLAAVCALSLAVGPGCTEAELQRVQADEQKVAAVAQAIQPKLIPACNAAMAMAGFAGPAAPWIIGGCGTAEAIDKLAADPSSTDWVNSLIDAAQKTKAAASA